MFRKLLLFTLLAVASFTASADMQSDRMAFIQKLIDQGIFQRVDLPANLPHLWLRPAFYALDFIMKQKFVNVVYAYYITEDPSYNIVVLYDSRTGKQIGKYAEVYGGLKLN